MAMNKKVKNPLILSTVSAFFLIPVLVLSHFLFRETSINTWLILAVNVVIYFVVIFLVFLFYGNLGQKS
ncbi:MAG: hypothetical protein FJW66_00975 [Actinobacteria bacterium]|nr:hypothetical protein [Actinomycetota bacterium]